MATNTNITFVDFVTPVPAVWLNHVNGLAQQGASVIEYGADPTGLTNSTTAIQNALNANSVVFIPPGTFTTGLVTIPSGRIVIGCGQNTIIQPISGFSGNALWTTAANSQGTDIGYLSFNLPVATYSATIPLFLQSGNFLHVHDIYMPAGGNIGIYSSNLTHTIIERCQVMASNTTGIMCTGSSQYRVTVQDCETGPTLVSHGIQMQGGTDVKIIRHKSTGAKGFGHSLYQVVGGWIQQCTNYNSTLEAFQSTDSSHYFILDNMSTWDNGISTDFGISVSAQGANCLQGIISRNYLRNNGKAGIALAANTGYAINANTVSDNVMENINALNLPVSQAGQASVLLYGSLCQSNLVTDNFVSDGLGSVLYTVAEYNLNGNGSPSLNHIINNRGNGSSFAVPRVLKSLTSLEALSEGGSPVPWTPTIASTSGTLGSVTNIVGQYYESEKSINYLVSFTIASNGTGAGALTFTFPNGYTATSGSGSGRESGLTGDSLNVAIGNSLGTIAAYNNNYCGGTGAVITVGGTFYRA